MGGEKDKSVSGASGRHHEGDDDDNETKRTRISGHVLRGDGLERDCLCEMIEGKGP